jgi:hypothetical protein
MMEKSSKFPKVAKSGQRDNFLASVSLVSLGFGVWGLGFGVWGLGFGVWGLGFGVWG